MLIRNETDSEAFAIRMAVTESMKVLQQAIGTEAAMSDRLRADNALSLSTMAADPASPHCDHAVQVTAFFTDMNRIARHWVQPARPLNRASHAFCASRVTVHERISPCGWARPQFAAWLTRLPASGTASAAVAPKGPAQGLFAASGAAQLRMNATISNMIVHLRGSPTVQFRTWMQLLGGHVHKLRGKNEHFGDKPQQRRQSAQKALVTKIRHRLRAIGCLGFRAPAPKSSQEIRGLPRL